jgi:hypothetical protein
MVNGLIISFGFLPIRDIPNKSETNMTTGEIKIPKIAEYVMLNLNHRQHMQGSVFFRAHHDHLPNFDSHLN